MDFYITLPQSFLMSENDTRFVINAPSVVSEVIDGEAIIMNVRSGNYYSSAGTGAVIWSWIEQGRTKSQMRELAFSRYDGDRQHMEKALELFFESLVRENLVREDSTVQAELPGGQAGDGVRDVFSDPKLCAYTDMQDLLFLDPIHDVDAIGWPEAKDPNPG